MAYSQALDEQSRLLKFVGTDFAKRMFRELWSRQMEGHGERARIQVGYTLQKADAYYWGADICGMIEQVCHDVPLAVTLTHDLLPSSYGFFWLARPIHLPGVIAPLQAITWGSEFADDGEPPAVSVHFWSDFSHEPGITATTQRTMPVNMAVWPFGRTLGESVNMRYVGGQPRQAEREEQGILRVIASMLLFINQRILVTPAETVPRATRRRLARENWAHEPLVRVVQLRRAAAGHSQDGSGAAVEWSCRWVVSGHWRQQFYPSTNSHRPIFVLPYVKGPQDAPLKPPSAKVFAVVR